MAEPYEVADRVATQFARSYADHNVDAVQKMISEVGSCGWTSLLQKSGVSAVPDFSDPGKEKLTVMESIAVGGNPWVPMHQLVPMLTSSPDTVCSAKTADVTPPKRFLQSTDPLPGLDHNGL